MTFHRALITGASSGIGLELARLLAKKNISLVLSGRNRSRLEEIAREVNAEEVIVCDLNDSIQREELVHWVREKAPDLVINNAGYGLYGDALTLLPKDQLAILDVNAKAPLEITLEAARALVAAKKRGVILNVSSVAGEFPCPGMSVYGGAKAFLTKVSQAINTELEGTGVHVLVSCPGMVATDFANRAAKKKVALSGRRILTASFAAKEIWKQIERRKEKHIFNWHYRLGSLFAAYLAPASFVKRIIWNQIKQRI